MCCLLAVLGVFGPRLAFLIYWLLPYGQLKTTAAFSGHWFWPVLGLIFMPWTVLMYTLVFPIFGLDWIWLGIAILVDISTYVVNATQRKTIIRPER